MTIRSELEALRFNNRFVRDLPADSEPRNFRRQVLNACYSRVNPTPVTAPKLLGYSHEVGSLIGLTSDAFQTDDVAQIFGGNRLLPGMDPFAMCYGGHQFGSWAWQLGDGRAINLGEVLTTTGEHWMLQLKGAGPTPYSRTADGLAVLRSSLREFLCSEAMHHLGVPTTRALSLVTTGERVVRDMFYDGNPQAEPGAVVCRVAPTFTRFGNFEIFAAREDYATLRLLIETTIRHNFPHLGEKNRDAIAAWFGEICRTTREMIVHWMRVGFVHGVMNTDNMSILGLTIDYGPYGWLENYDPYWTPNTTDAQGRRYRFGQQPQVALWNLVQLANALVPIVEATEPLEEPLNAYNAEYDRLWQQMMCDKLGIGACRGDEDVRLINELLQVLQLVETDMTIFFRKLADLRFDSTVEESLDWTSLSAPLKDAYYDAQHPHGAVMERLTAWLKRYRIRTNLEAISDSERRERMNRVNPKYVLRNYLAQLAIDRAEQDDASLLHKLHECLRHPYDDQPGCEEFAAKRPEWARERAGCSMLSCSS